MNARIQNLFLYQELIQKQRSVLARVYGQSMLPTFSEGDYVWIDPAKKYCIGDIVVYLANHEKSIIIHRIVARYRNVLITKGDGNYTYDEPIVVSRILGKIRIKQGWAKRMHAHVKSLRMLKTKELIHMFHLLKSHAIRN